MRLTAENYFSPEANMEYMSASQYKAFRACEAAALAELRGEWRRPESVSLRLGSYVDAALTGDLEAYRDEHPELFKRDGSLKAEYQSAQEAAERLAGDDLARLLLSGRHQAIKVGKIGGVRYKAKIDSLLSSAKVESICKRFPEVRKLVPFGGPMIVDLKYMRDFDPIWSEEYHDKISFAEYWGYDYQGAVYQALDKRSAPFVIVAATKESETNIDAFHIPDDALSLALAEIEENSPRYAAIKKGEIAPVGCGKCDYCRSVKKLYTIKHYKETA